MVFPYASLQKQKLYSINNPIPIIEAIYNLHMDFTLAAMILFSLFILFFKKICFNWF